MMVDPISIVAISITAAHVTKSIILKLRVVRNAYEAPDADIQHLIDETSHLRHVIKALNSVLLQPAVDISRISSESPDIYQALIRPLEKLNDFLGSLNHSLQDIKQDGKDNKYWARIKQAALLALNRERVDGYRTHIQHHHLSLQSAMHVLQLYMLSQVSAPDMGTIHRVAGSILSAESSSEHLQDLQDLQNAARDIMRDASQRAESSSSASPSNEASILERLHPTSTYNTTENITLTRWVRDFSPVQPSTPIQASHVTEDDPSPLPTARVRITGQSTMKVKKIRSPSLNSLSSATDGTNEPKQPIQRQLAIALRAIRTTENPEY